MPPQSAGVGCHVHAWGRAGSASGTTCRLYRPSIAGVVDTPRSLRRHSRITGHCATHSKHHLVGRRRRGACTSTCATASDRLSCTLHQHFSGRSRAMLGSRMEPVYAGRYTTLSCSAMQVGNNPGKSLPGLTPPQSPPSPGRGSYRPCLGPPANPSNTCVEVAGTWQFTFRWLAPQPDSLTKKDD